MKVLLLYRPDSEGESAINDYLREFSFRTGKELPTIDPDSREGVDICKNYDILNFPTFIAIDNDSRELQRWDGELLPPIGEISYYLQEN